MPHDDHSAGTAPAHPLPLRALHWVTVSLILLAFGLVWGREVLDNDALRKSVLDLHRWLGLGVGALTLARSAVRLKNGKVPRTRTVRGVDDVPFAVRSLGAVTHFALYACLLGLPLLGWLLTSAQGHELAWAGVHVPMPLAPDPDLADTLQEAHEWVGTGMAALISVHITAVIWHRFWRRDDVWGLMWPATRK